MLARLHLNINTIKSLLYAEKAIALGDTASTQIKAYILDSGLIKNSKQFSSNRLQLTSKLLSKLDPCFSFNVQNSEKLNKSDFIKHITGTLKNIISFNYFPPVQWQHHPLETMRTILTAGDIFACVICLSVAPPGAACTSCGYKVKIKVKLNNYFLINPAPRFAPKLA